MDDCSPTYYSQTLSEPPLSAKAEEESVGSVPGSRLKRPYALGAELSAIEPALQRRTGTVR